MSLCVPRPGRSNLCQHCLALSSGAGEQFLPSRSHQRGLGGLKRPDWGLTPTHSQSGAPSLPVGSRSKFGRCFLSWSGFPGHQWVNALSKAWQPLLPPKCCEAAAPSVRGPRWARGPLLVLGQKMPAPPRAPQWVPCRGAWDQAAGSQPELRAQACGGPEPCTSDRFPGEAGAADQGTGP